MKQYENYNELIIGLRNDIKNSDSSTTIDTILKLNQEGDHFINNRLKKDVILVGDKYERLCLVAIKECIRKNANECIIIGLEQNRIINAIDKNNSLIELSKESILYENVESLRLFHYYEGLENKTKLDDKYWARTKQIETPLSYAIKNSKLKIVNYLVNELESPLLTHGRLSLKTLIDMNFTGIIKDNIGEIISNGVTSKEMLCYLINSKTEDKTLLEIMDNYNDLDESCLKLIEKNADGQIYNLIEKLILKKNLKNTLISKYYKRVVVKI